MSATGAGEVRVVDALFGAAVADGGNWAVVSTRPEGRLRFRPSRCKALNLRTSCMPPLGTIPFQFQVLAPKWDTLRFHCPLQNRPAEAATPQIIFCAATPAPGLRPLV